MGKHFSKTVAKNLAKECLFCGETNPSLFDCHRILPGSENGQYCNRNTVIACANCHRRIHNGEIIIEGKYFSTSGKWIVYYAEGGVSKTKSSVI